ncbi:hypothetical protein T310_5391 [Rasamsonia emersonii CBS 393.64]|uniref:Uncharacterized protein n=1 Tax=Rasamsonia emersonii (strain ATCC 16479 / CBS 393.64 / IMI 116815) TaxID=1408163 RepID=A0A0F4YSG5_RASE3|nr:hypothetical protein T310_5391 [Rasamsonia emersonii CBS 393.64]KKA20578.1 hypothetical protein T310_5391 [Rasamsonia emersonii CBS 393.64]
MQVSHLDRPESTAKGSSAPVHECCRNLQGPLLIAYAQSGCIDLLAFLSGQGMRFRDHHRMPRTRGCRFPALGDPLRAAGLQRAQQPGRDLEDVVWHARA